MRKTMTRLKRAPLQNLTFALATAFLLWVSGVVAAETITIPVGQQAQQKSALSRPANGMTQSEVEAIYGKPLDWREAVGDPPISSWIYADFVVYFEYDHVIHSVLHPKGQPLASSDS